MSTKLENFKKEQEKSGLLEIQTGDSVRVSQKMKEGEKERTQVFEGLVIAKKHGQGIQATITVRKVVSGIGVEKIFPLHSPAIEKIELVKREKARRSKLYYLREAKGKRGKLKQDKFAQARVETKVEPENAEIKPQQ